MLAEAINFLSSLTFERFIEIFWYWVLFDFTRYIVTIIPILAVIFYERVQSRHQGKRSRAAAESLPEVTILLVGHNEEESLEKTVLSLHEQRLDRMQVIVVDDGSTDGTHSLAQALEARGLVDVVLSTGVRSGKSAALNFGRHYCRYDIIVVADIDTTFDRDAMARLLAPLEDPQVGAVSGNLGVRNVRSGLLARLQALEYLDSISIGRRFTAIVNILAIVSGAFGAFRKSAVEAVGGWEVGPGEDADITDKLRRAGWRIEFAPHAWALTDVPESLTAFTRQRLRWNRSVIRFRFRKFNLNLNPFASRFYLRNAFSTINILFFQAVLAALFFIYLVSLPLRYGDMSYIILFSIVIFYILEDIFIFIFIVFMYPERDTIPLIPYIPLSSLFRAFILRGVRLVAYVDELIFRRSYKDEYVPRRVLQHTEQF